MKSNDDIKEATERYRRAAEETLNQLDWCVDYFRRIRKPRIADALAQRRSQIRQRMRGDD